MLTAPNYIRGPNLFKLFVEELGGPKLVCKFLDVTERTIWRWLSEETAPKMAVLSLFWETQYGRSLVQTDQVNEIRLMYRRIEILNGQYARAKDIIIGLRKLQSCTVNEAYFDELDDPHFEMPNTYGPSAQMLAAAGKR
jgi:hypothetical protein